MAATVDRAAGDRAAVERGAILVPARADAFVDLADPDAKGIHMSRLFLALQEGLEFRDFDLEAAEAILDRFLESHADLSTRGFLRIDYDQPLRRDALLSSHSGWRHYAVTTESEKSGGVHRHRLRVRIVYSSTCPCSAALARQVLQSRFESAFAGHGWVSIGHVRNWLGTLEATAAVPHSQRSHADVTVDLGSGGVGSSGVAEPSAARRWPIEELVDLVETALETPVQTAVKREDEQEFARLSGANLKFCEDAARAVRAALVGQRWIEDFRVVVRHLESLHPHDAVAIVTKGVPGGFRA
jgi:GTP cyclohydrolase I